MATTKKNIRDAAEETTEVAEATEAPKRAKKVKEPVPCQCGLVKDPKTGEWVEGQCEGTTKSKFAQGHDARLKGYLLKLHRAGNGGTYQGQNPVDVLMANGWITDPAQADAKPRPSRAKVKRQVKVGRQTYDVTKIDGETVHYKTDSGEEKTTTLDKLVEVPEADAA